MSLQTATPASDTSHQEMATHSTRPLNVMFVITSMPVGGAETLLVNMMRRFDPARVRPSICCLKQKDVLGEELSSEFPVYENQINHKFDLAVAGRLKRLFRKEKIDAMITVGAGDKMFWGRLAAYNAGVPVVLSALHSTGWPDGVGRLNRMLTRITDGFIAVAQSHAEFMVTGERFPQEKVFMIPNGIDTNRFVFDATARESWRTKVGIPMDSPTVGIVAALRPEKDHGLFLEISRRVLEQLPNAHFVIAGDGPERPGLEKIASEKNIGDNVHFLGSISDIPGVLSMVDMFALTSKNEASPVSILEAMSCQRPVVAPNVGSISESVLDGQTGFMAPAGDADEMTKHWLKILGNLDECQSMGVAARDHVIQNSSLDSMTEGYMHLVESLFSKKNPGVAHNTGIFPSIEMSVTDMSIVQTGNC